MKPRSSRVMGEQASASSRGAKVEALAANGANNQQSAAAQARKRRSSINVYDQPSSLNSRLRQLETDMLRLDEDRTKLFDDTHSALTQYELKLSEIHAILKSRQDNVEKYVEDMKLLLQAKEDFEKQTKLLNDKHDRIHEKFMHRETVISREIKLLKNKFELLEKNRQFRSMLQKSNQMTGADSANDDLISGLDGSSELSSRKRSETNTIHTGELDSCGPGAAGGRLASTAAADMSRGATAKSVRIKISKIGDLSRFLAATFGSSKKRRRGAGSKRVRRKSNKVSSMADAQAVEPALEQQQQREVVDALGQARTGSAGASAKSCHESEPAPAAPNSHLEPQLAEAVAELAATTSAAVAPAESGAEQELQAGGQTETRKLKGGFFKRLFKRR